MKRNLYLLIALILFGSLIQAQVSNHKHEGNSSKAILFEKIKKDCQFFKGDTLAGLDLDALLHESIDKYTMYSELRSYIKQREFAFVRKKFNIGKSQDEITETTRYVKVNTVLAGVCNNLDFENGNFNGWTGGIGYNPSTNSTLVITSPAISTLGANSPETSCSYHTLVNGGVDPYSGLPMVNPTGGSWSCRLGGELLNIGCDTYNNSSVLWNAYFNAGFINPNVTSCSSNDPVATNTASPIFGRDCSNGESIQQTFPVTAANCLFSYNYMVVMANAPHSGDSCNYFRVQVFDQSGALIPCLSYFVETDTTGHGLTPAGFLASPSTDIFGNGVLYTPWTQNSLNLQPYIGTNITVKFTAAGCYLGGHFSYAYIDCSCGPLDLIVPSGPVCSGLNQTIVGPPNGVGGTYSWSGPGIVSGATTQTVTANQSGTYTVTVTNQKGCSYKLDTTITFYPKPIVSVNSATTCPGNPSVLNATSTGGAGTLTYSWTPATGLSVTNDSTTTATVNANTSYTVTATSIHSCTNTAVANITVPVAPPPVFSAPPVCLGAPSVFTNTTGGTGTFNWDFGDGSLVLINQTTPTHTYSSSGNFVVTCTVNAGGCIGISSNTVTVNANPTVAVTNSTICSGAGPVTLTASGAITYTWNTGATGATLSVNPTATTNYTVTGATAAGCTNAATTSITVIANPTVTATGSAICPTFAANLIANGATTYTWTGPNLTGSTGSNVTANPTTTSTYTVIGTTSACTATAVATITVNPTPTVTVVSPPSVCPNDVIAAPTFTSNPNDPATTFMWTNNNLLIGLPGSGVGIPPAFTASPNNSLTTINGIITVVPTLNGCVGPPATYTITLKPTPFANHVSNVEYCPSINTSGITFSAIPAGPTSFAWINTVNAIGLGSSGSGNIPSFLTVNTNTFAVISTVHVVPTLNGCVGPDSTFLITINPLPTPAFMYSKTCIGDVTHFTDESTVGVGTITNWGWDFNNDGIFLDATNANPQIQLTPAGPHQVGLTVTSNKGCKNKIYGPVYINPLPTPAFVGDNLAGCPVHPVVFTESSSIATPSHIVSWNWDFGNGQTSSAQYPTTVMYNNGSPVQLAFYSVTLTVKTDSGCSATLVKPNYITVYPKPRAGFTWGPSDVDILDPTVQFYNTSVGGSGNLPLHYYLGDVFIDHFDTANWSNLNNPRHTYTDQPYTYYVTQWVQNVYGCKDSVTQPIIINPVYTFYIPNAYSPNGDGRNEGFKGTGIGIDLTTYNLWVFDRWGNQIFHSTDLEETWNGTVNGSFVQEDVYVWKARFSDMGGTKHEYHGHVSIIK